MPSFTKQAIMQGFWELLEQRPLSQITVKDIAGHCGINRNSFYYHFQDIPALIEEIVMAQANGIIARYPTIDSMETCLLATLEFARENRRAMLHIYNSVNRALYEQFLWQVCESVVRAYGEAALRGVTLPQEDADLILRYYKCLCFGVAIEWLNSSVSQDEARAYIHRMVELRRGTVETMIERSLQSAQEKQ